MPIGGTGIDGALNTRMLAEVIALAPGAYEALFVGLAHTDEVLDAIADAAARAAAATAGQLG